MVPLLIAAGLGAWALAVVVGLLEKRARSSWKRTQGQVIDQVRRKPAGSHTVYAHRIRFTTDSGESVDLDPVLTRFPYYALGQPVPVLYDPSRPTHAVLDVFPFRWTSRVSWLIVLGFVLIFIGALILAG